MLTMWIQKTYFKLILLVYQIYTVLLVFTKTYRRDLTIVAKLYQCLPVYKRQLERKSIYESFRKIVRDHPQKTAFLFEDECWTFSDVKELSDTIAIYFEGEGYKKGDAIALLLDNCPDYVCIWLGLSQIGVPVALINTNLLHDSLIHSIKIANCKGVVFGSNFAREIVDLVKKRLEVKCYQYNRKSEATPIAENCIDLKNKIGAVCPSRSLKGCYNILVTDPVLYVYTSGTTGLPKTVPISHQKLGVFCYARAIILSNLRNAIVYVPLPLYHGAGGLLSVGFVIFWGATVVLRTKFSASNYWKDCIKFNCNVAQYIGEMCRYILHNCPEKVIHHPVKAMFGNGLKPEVWQAFQQRYNVPQIYEFYGSTEGNIVLVNFDNKIGSIGFIPPYLQKYSPLQLVKYCEATAEPIRDKNGFCIKSDVHRKGLAVGLITKGGKWRSSSLRVGYLDAYETDKKILHNVFESGDQYFNSGDVFSCDEFGYYYFVDRLGDTFRWKGENVSTCEVETVISNIIGLQDAVAYGVKIPGCEGKGGMVSISLDHRSLNEDAFLKTLKERLPSYAIPIFIRFNCTSVLTSTFKYQKQQLIKDGFNIYSTQDVILYHNSSLGSYERLTPEIYEDIQNKKIKF